MKSKYAYWLCQVVGWGTYSAIGASSVAHSLGWESQVTVGYGLYFLYSILLTHLLRLHIRRKGWLLRPAYGPIVGAAAAVGLIQAALVIGINALLTGGRSEFLRSPGVLIGSAIGIATIAVGWAVVYVAITSGRDRQLLVREAELRALEAQINPHFLFNCLNSIRGLVVENPPLAQDLITRLANILRYNLHRDAGHTVPLSDEIAAASDYLALERARFEDRLQVKLAIEESSRAVRVPPMLVQTLVENAIKHGIATLPQGGEVSVQSCVANGVLTVEVDNSGTLVRTNGTGIGLRNIRERLRMLYGARAGLELRQSAPGRVAAIVRIPACEP